MLNITKVNNSIKVEGLDNKQFPDNGTLMIPLNSVILTLDESNIATFRSAANNDVLFSGVITDIQIAGSTVTKQTITTAFTAIANSSGGGGTVDAYTKAETDALLATKANESELSDYATVESLATVAMSGDYNDLSNKPTIPVVPTDVSAFKNDAGYITQEEVIINEAFPNSWHTTGTMADLIADINADTDAVAGKVYMDTVSFSDLPGEMQQAELKAEIISQLSNSKVIVFTVTSSEVSPYHWEYTSAYGQTNSWREWVTPAAMQSALSVKANSADLATVATTGSYNDLTNKPTIPAAQIQSDWNQSDNSAADYIKNKPVNVSAFTNDAGYLTQHQSLADYSTTQEMNTAIATATNDMATMTWVGEQGYLTQHQDISDLFNGAEYDTQTKRINFKHGNTVLAYIDATAFIKDGMVSNVEVKNVTISGEYVLCLVITFNTDAGKEPINIPISSIFDASNYYTKTETDNTFVKPADLATVATSGDYTDLSNKPTIPAAQVQSDWNEADTTSKAYIQNKPTIPTVPTNVSAFTNDAGYTTNTGTITGITMNGASKGTSGVVDLGTVITDISGKQDVIDSSHKLDADLVDDTTSANKFVTASDKSTWSGKQDALVSGTNIKTINNESILGSGNITIQGGGSSYTAGDNINITNDVISVDIDDEKKVIASALVELHNDKADKSQLNNYQFKGNYVEQSAVDASIAAAVANYRTEAEAINVEKVDAAAFNDLNKRVTALETALGNISSVLDAINGETI